MRWTTDLSIHCAAGVEQLDADTARGQLATAPTGEPLSWRTVVERWQSDPAFGEFTTGALAALPWPAFYWETPPITAATLDQPFEWVATNAPELTTPPPDEQSFLAYLKSGRGTDTVRVFQNLGGDATLVAPCRNGDPTWYAHLANFLRDAPAAQRTRLWATLGGAVEERVGTDPLWVSTSGTGVAWLHVRLDSSPKYYAHAPYRAV